MSHLVACTGIVLGIVFTIGVLNRWDRTWFRDRARRRGGLDVRAAMEHHR